MNIYPVYKDGNDDLYLVDDYITKINKLWVRF